MGRIVNMLIRMVLKMVMQWVTRGGGRRRRR